MTSKESNHSLNELFLTLKLDRQRKERGGVGRWGGGEKKGEGRSSVIKRVFYGVPTLIPVT